MTTWIVEREQSMRWGETGNNKERSHTDRKTDYRSTHTYSTGQPCTLDVNTSEDTVDTCCDKSFMMWIFFIVCTSGMHVEYTYHRKRNAVRPLIPYLLT